MIADLVSLTHLAVFLVPAVVWLQTRESFWLALIAAEIVTGGIVAGLKEWFGGAGPWGRPAGARGCDLWCVGGPVAGAPGFPSGHMTAVTLFVAAVYDRVGSVWVLVWGVPWVAAMAWSRWIKRCHSPAQLAGGAALGLLAASALCTFTA
jgi:membrane-associated phospholipid phosphatase